MSKSVFLHCAAFTIASGLVAVAFAPLLELAAAIVG
jgi:hypothetical protein